MKNTAYRVNLRNLDDNTLIKFYLAGNTEAMGIIYTRYRSKIMAAIRLRHKGSFMDPSIEEDILQDCMLKAMDALQNGKYTDVSKMGSWLCIIASNLTVDYLRNKNKKKYRHLNCTPYEEMLVFLKNLPDNTQSPLMKIIDKETQNFLQEIIALLPKQKQRELIQWRFYEGKSFQKISEIHNESINTELGRMRYAINNLTRIYNKLVEQDICLPSNLEKCEEMIAENM